MKSLICAISFVIMASLVSSAYADDIPPWWTVISAQMGSKEMRNDYPVEPYSILGLSMTLPFTDIEPSSSAYALALDYFFSVPGDEKTDSVYMTKDYYLGIRQLRLFRERTSMYWGGGVAVIHADANINEPSLTLVGHDTGVGYWLNAGLDYQLLNRDSLMFIGYMSVGLFVRYSDVELRDLGINGGGLIVGISFGLVGE